MEVPLKVIGSQLTDDEFYDEAYPMVEMQLWCKAQSMPIVVLANGGILVSWKRGDESGERIAQNAKITMLNVGIKPGEIIECAEEVIKEILDKDVVDG